MDALSAKQLSALRWIHAHGTLPPVEPRTWRSLMSRGLVDDGRGYRDLRLTPAGMSYVPRVNP